MFEKDNIKSSESQSEYIPCPNVVGAFSGYKDGLGVCYGPIRCNSWTCPVCAPLKKRALWHRFQNGTISEKTTKVYGRKFLTLTAPGKAFRALYNPEEAYNIMAYHFSNLMRNLRHKYGHFDYMRVAEPQKDGTPHFHVLLVGDNIAPKEILKDIEYHWCESYRMGHVKLNKVPFKDGNHAMNYILKYITKSQVGFGRYKRIFTASKDALAKVKKVEWDSVKIHLGRVNDTGVHHVKVSADEFLHMASGFGSDGQYNTLESVLDKILNVYLGKAMKGEKKEVLHE